MLKNHTTKSAQQPTETFYSSRCEESPACCTTRKNAYVFAKPFKPPLIGTQKEFCKQAARHEIPVRNCELGKPVTFIYPKSLFFGLKPAEKPGGERELKNWKKWCTVWHTNQEAFQKGKQIPPALMTCGEGWRRKLEDVELVHRTIHNHHLDGFYDRNTVYPDQVGTGKECGDGVQETLTRGFFREYPPMEKLRIPKDIRKEMHLPQRCPQGKEDEGEKKLRWKWEKYWNRSKYLQETKAFLREDIEKHGPTTIITDKLIVKGKALHQTERKLKPGDPGHGLAHPIPELRLSQESDGPATKNDAPEDKSPIYTEERGPVLLIEGRTFKVLLRMQAHTTDKPLRENQFLLDVMDRFATTTRSKDIRYICLTNHGTTAIRFQWLRAPPSAAIRSLLANPAKMLNLNEKPPNIDQTCDEPTSKLSNKVGVHLTTSRKVDPALTRTLRIMRNCASSSKAYEDLLLLLAFRIPRLRKLLVRRTGRQLDRKRLPIHIQKMYIAMKEKKKLARIIKRKIKPRPSAPVSETSAEVEEEGENWADESQTEEGTVYTQDTCPCQKSISSGRSMFGEVTEAGDFFKPIRARRICECSDPKPNAHCQPHLDQRNPSYELDCEDYIPPPQATADEVSIASTKSFLEEVFECLGEWQEQEAIGEANLETRSIPEGATEKFYPLGYGKPLVSHKKCRRPPAPDTKYIAPPKQFDNWQSDQRNSFETEEFIINSEDNEDDEEYQKGPVFRELEGFEVTRDYDSQTKRAKIYVRLPKDAKTDGWGEWDNSRRDSLVTPLRATPNTHQLNTQTLTPTELDQLQGRMTPTPPEELSGETEWFDSSRKETQVEQEQTPRQKELEPPMKFIKDPCFEFHFRELPGILLPGQTLEFPIIFRPRKPGFYFENLYLVTHPRLCEATYALRLNGICMDPDFPIKSSKKNPQKLGNCPNKPVLQTRIEKVESEMQEEMVKNQGRDLFEAIIDNVFYVNDTQKSTLPYGKVTTEGIFYAHNPALCYHHGVAEDALKIVRQLAQLIVPMSRLEEPHICSLNIESLYKEILRPDAICNDASLKTDEAETLFAKLHACSKILIKPSPLNAIPLEDQKFNSCYCILDTLVFEATRDIEGIEDSYNIPELAAINLAAIEDRILRQETRQILQKQQQEFLRKSLEVELEEEEFEDEEHGPMYPPNRVHVGTQKDLNDPPPPEEHEPETETETDAQSIPDDKRKKKSRKPKAEKSKSMMKLSKKGKKVKGKKERKGHSSKSSKWESIATVIEEIPNVHTPSPVKSPEKEIEAIHETVEYTEEYVGEDNESVQIIPEMNRVSRGSQTDQIFLTPEIQEKIDKEFERIQHRRKHQATRVVFENHLALGIERMLSVIDNMKYMNNYKTSDYIVRPSNEYHM